VELIQPMSYALDINDLGFVLGYIRTGTNGPKPLLAWRGSPADRALVVTSSGADAPVLVQVSPADLRGVSDGPAPIARHFAPTTLVTLSAPVVVNGRTFSKWQRDGVDVATANTMSLTLNSSDLLHTVRAVYREAPPAPTGLSAQVSQDNSVRFDWTPPAGSVVPDGYVLEGGATPGASNGSVPLNGSVTSLSLTLPSGIYYVRVRAVLGGVNSLPSNEVTVRVGVPQPPDPPIDLRGVANGQNLRLQWRLPSTGGRPSTVFLDVAGAVTTTLPLAPAQSFAFNGVPPGAYTFSVRAANASGVSSSSGSVVLVFPGQCAPPLPPTQFSASVVGNVVNLSWAAPLSGLTPTGYRVIVAGTYNLEILTPDTRLNGQAPPGVYALSVVAVDECGRSAPTATVQVVVP
jgi:hypothetical protein